MGAGADVTVAAITGPESGLPRSEREQCLDTLTPTQRKVFEHTRGAGYCQWPRGCSTRDLAADPDVSKATLLERLRKDESIRLDPMKRPERTFWISVGPMPRMQPPGPGLGNQ